MSLVTDFCGRIAEVPMEMVATPRSSVHRKEKKEGGWVGVTQGELIVRLDRPCPKE